MAGALLVAVVASIGNLLQGWDNATIAGAVLYIKKEFKLESEPTVEGLIIAMSLIGATIITMFSGAVSDRVGRRPLLIVSSIFYFVSGLIMLWSPNVYVLLLARLIDGFGIGLAVTLVPIYISETAPSEIRGSLNTLPQFSGCGGMFLSYCMLFGMSLMPKPDWRIMLGVLSVPSLLYFSLTIFYLPESPRWLVSKGRMVEAKQVLQKLRGREDVSGEMALLVEGLGVGGDTSIEEYIIGPANELCDEQGASNRKEQMTLYGSEDGIFWNAQPFKGQCALGNLSRSGMANQSVPFMDPLVTLFGTVHEKPPEMISILGVAEQQHPETTEWDEESLQKGNKDYESDDDDEFDDDDDDESDNSDDLRSPLLSAETTRIEEKDTDRGSSLMQRNSGGEVVSGIDIGGGWKLAWTWSEIEKERDFKRLYLHQEGASGSLRGEIPEEGQYIHAAALVSDPALHSKNFLDLHKVGPAVVHPSEALAKCPRWKDLLEPGVRHALLVGIGIQILQQFAGINGVLYYTPQILKQAGVEVLLANIGVSSDSASILTSGVTTLLMIPAIGIAMRLMDISGRRSLLLFTIPCLIASLIVLVVANLVEMGMMVHAVLSTVSVITYFCCFVMGFGPIPNILCAEIFPTRVRGMCIAVCALTFWFGDIIVTYSLPLMLNSIGLAGVFGIYAVVCVIAFIFVFLEVPETKGMPLEVIAEFFAVGSVSVRIPNHENSESTIDIN